MQNNLLYTCNECFIFIFETKEKAIEANSLYEDAVSRTILIEEYAASSFVAEAKFATQYWTKRLGGTKVIYSNPKEPIFVVSREDKYWNVIIGEKIGWIIAEEWLELKEITDIINT